MIGQFIEMIDMHYGIVSSTGGGSNYHVRVLRYATHCDPPRCMLRSLISPPLLAALWTVRSSSRTHPLLCTVTLMLYARTWHVLPPSVPALRMCCALQVVDVLPPEADSSIRTMQMTERPDVKYEDIGGMDIQKQEVKEAVELPLTHFELYKQIGIDPPRGVRAVGVGRHLRRSHVIKALLTCSVSAGAHVWPTWYWQDHAGQGSRQRYHCLVHQRGRL